MVVAPKALGKMRDREASTPRAGGEGPVEREWYRAALLDDSQEESGWEGGHSPASKSSKDGSYFWIKRQGTALCTGPGRDLVILEVSFRQSRKAEQTRERKCTDCVSGNREEYMELITPPQKWSTTQS